MSCSDCSANGDPGPLVALVYELLDAHADTMRLIGGDADALRLEAHLGYLQGLQRVGREVLAGSLASQPLA